MKLVLAERPSEKEIASAERSREEPKSRITDTEHTEKLLDQVSGRDNITMRPITTPSGGK